MTRRLRLPKRLSACLFDLDGVLIRTAEPHAAAWKRTFDAFLRDRAARGRRAPVSFDAVADYDTHVDGRPRADSVRSFLASRGIELPEGSPGDPASADTVHVLGRRKNELVQEMMAQHGAYGVRRLRRLPRGGERGRAWPGVVTSSEDAHAALRAAELQGAFDFRGRRGACARAWPGGQARARCVPGGSAPAGCGARAGGGAPGRAGRCRRGARGRVWPGRRRDRTGQAASFVPPAPIRSSPTSPS